MEKTVKQLPSDEQVTANLKSQRDHRATERVFVEPDQEERERYIRFRPHMTVVFKCRADLSFV